MDGDKGALSWEDNSLFYSHEHRVDSNTRREIALDPLPSIGQFAVLDEFLAAIRENREPECSANDNLRTLQMAFGAVDSAKSGEKVELQTIR